VGACTRSLELLIDHLGSLGQAGLNGEESTLKERVDVCFRSRRLCKMQALQDRSRAHPFESLLHVLEFTCALFLGLREALNGKFKKAEICQTGLVPIGCVNILDVVLQHKANIPLRKAMCHFEKHGLQGIIDIWASGAPGGSLVFWVIVIGKDGRLGTRRTIPLASMA
jgi:hypothetical protein